MKLCLFQSLSRPFGQWRCLGLVLALALPLPLRAARNAGALVLVNSRAADYADFANAIEPYLKQFGVPYRTVDIARERLGSDVASYALVVIGHRGLDVPRQFLTRDDEQNLLAAIKSGTGLLSVDGLLAAWQDKEPRALYPFAEEIFGLRYRLPAKAAEIVVGASAVSPRLTPVEHYITNLAPGPRTVTLKRPITAPGVVLGPQDSALAYVGTEPLLVATTYGHGRALLWLSYEWTRPDVKGKLYGLDDLVWRGLVWAARKPFVLRGMPHFLALRIDDVSGFGLGANRHLGYVSTANRYGLKPWLGIFLDDLREDAEATEALAHLTRQGLATASVHARRWHEFFYLDEPLWTDGSNRNIAGRDWPAAKMDANFEEAEKFFSEHRIVKSKYVLPHFYQFGTNNFEGLARWGAEFASTVLEPGRGYGTPMLLAGPYLPGEPERPSNAPDPVFIAAWLKAPGHPEFDHHFFNFVLEVRDVTGYEWAPSHVPVEEAIRRGAVESRREFDSLLPAVLFTHESDHIQYIEPGAWDRILKGVMDDLKPYQPVPVTLDYLAQYMRALRTSTLVSAEYDEARREGSVAFSGSSDLATKFYVFESRDGGPVAHEWEAPAFRGKTTVHWQAERRP